MRVNIKVAIYTKEEQRSLGAFYTPLIHADLIARPFEPLCPAANACRNSFLHYMRLNTFI